MDLLAFARAAMTLAGAVVMGAGFLLWYVRGALGKPAGIGWRQRVMVMVLAAAALGVVTTASVVVGTAANAAGDDRTFAFDTGAVATFVSQTWSGRVLFVVFLCSVGAFLGAGLAFLFREKLQAADILTLVAAGFAGLGLAVIAFASHPTALEPQWIGLGLSILHRLALGLWLGGLPALLLLIRSGTEPGEWRHLAVMILARFSGLAIASMGVILVTGIFLTWYIVGNFASLIGTGYGRLLVAKLLALAGVLVIAHGLRKSLLPKLHADPNDPALASYGTRVKIETGLAVLIVVLAAVMANRAPPEHEDIYWLLPFRFSFRATWDLPWVPTLFIGGSILFVIGVGVLVAAWRFSPQRLGFVPRYGMALGAFTALAGAVMALPAISVQAFPDTYLTPDVDFAAESISHGLVKYEDNCVLCHGVGGRGDGPAGFGLPIPPADLTAAHAANHTAGDMFWWLTHGIPGSAMPAFADTLTPEDRWDVINFLQNFALGYKARIITPRIVPNKPWLGPPDLSVTDEKGETQRLRTYRRDSALLVVIAYGQEGRARVEQLIAARDRLARYGTKVVLIAPGPAGAPLRAMAAGKILVVDTDAEAAAATFGLFTRTLTNAKTATVRVPEMNAEFLIDRSGYLRARWLPSEEQDASAWSDIDVLERQLALLAQEPLRDPPIDHDH